MSECKREDQRHFSPSFLSQVIFIGLEIDDSSRLADQQSLASPSLLLGPKYAFPHPDFYVVSEASNSGLHACLNCLPSLNALFQQIKDKLGHQMVFLVIP